MKELVIMVEGPGDVQAANNLAERILRRQNEAPPLYIGETLKVGDIYALLAPPKPPDQNGESKLIRFLGHAERRSNIGGILILLDGDAKVQKPIPTTEGKKNFCPVEIGRFMIEQAMQKTRAGRTYSLSVVFACQEFESWILAGVPELAEQTTGELLEMQPRNAKNRIRELTGQVYHETQDQVKYARKIDIEALMQREPKMRSFLRLENALRELGESVRNGVLICSPRRQ